MKKVILIATLFLFTYSYAQLQTPQPSSAVKINQTVGLTQFSLEYARPSAKERAVFGHLVPYGKKWRTGANFNTLIEFDDNIVFGGQEVKAGKYALYSKPKPDQWKVYLYQDIENWGLPQEWDEDKVVAVAEVKRQKVDYFTETFSINFNTLTSSSAHLLIEWENTRIEVPIEVPTDQKVESSIKEVMANEPTARDFYQAAAYYYETQKDINQAKEWIDKAMDQMDEKQFWTLRLQSLIHAEAGNKKSAIKLAKKSLKAAEKAGNDDYVRMNKDSLEEWEAK